MVLDPSRRMMVESRVRRRMALWPDLSPRSYMQRLHQDPAELRELIDALTVNETYFYRDPLQLATFEQVLDELLVEKAALPLSRLRIWSAGCSIGCEPFTLGILIHQSLERRGRALDWQVLGTDISTSALQVAGSALYTDREVKDVPPALLPVYFRKEGSYWAFQHPIRHRVHFRYSNLLKPGSEVDGPFDVIFCRNVMIYFDDAGRRKTASILHDRLAPGGKVFLGASESLTRVSNAYRLQRVGSGFVYVKA